MNKRDKQRRGVDTPREVTPGDVARAYQACFASEDGQIVLADLVRRFGFTRHSTFNENPYKTAHNEGQRTVLQHVGFMVDVDPEAYEKSKQPQGER